MVAYRSAWLLGVVVWSACVVGEQSDEQGAGQMETVAVAKRALEAGETVDYEILEKVPLHESCLTADLVKAPDADRICGKVLQVPVGKGEPLRWSIVRKRWSDRLSSIVRKTGRALTLEVSGLEWVRPNDHVDIIATLPDPATGKPATLTLIQNAIVLTVGSHTGETAMLTPDPQDPNAGKATFMLLPEEVDQVVAAARAGPLTVSLRNPEDLGGTDQNRAVLVDDLFVRDDPIKPAGKTK